LIAATDISGKPERKESDELLRTCKSILGATNDLLKPLESESLKEESLIQLFEIHKNMKIVATSLSEFIANTIVTASIIKPSSTIISTFSIFSNLTKHLLNESTPKPLGIFYT
jgi:hypothetical protein